MIQQLADRIIREFGLLGETIEINALDGNGGKLAQLESERL